jgi:hypothetical protein
MVLDLHAGYTKSELGWWLFGGARVKAACEMPRPCVMIFKSRCTKYVMIDGLRPNEYLENFAATVIQRWWRSSLPSKRPPSLILESESSMNPAGGQLTEAWSRSFCHARQKQRANACDNFTFRCFCSPCSIQTY